jgi:hypothetical protein
MKWVVLVLLMVGFVSAVDVDFDCPDEIFVGEEFDCSLEVFDGDGVYDVKVDLDGERDSVLETWNDGAWKSGYYYLRDFVEDGDEVDVRLRVSEEGRYDGVLKLRQGDKREFFDIEMRVREGVEDEKQIVGGEVEVFDGQIVLGEDGVIVLNGNLLNEVVYESKNARVGGYLIYGFALFLIFIIGVLVWERF